MENDSNPMKEPASLSKDLLDIEQYLHMYEQMLKIRYFDEQVNELYKTGKMPGLAHLYIGEEAIAVGVCEALEHTDYITSTHRGHGHCLAKGAQVDRMFAELLGKAAGYCGGKGGSMHIADPETGNLGANAIVGGGAGIATGAAFSNKFLGNGRVTVCFFGEGAMGQGVIYEVMNMASLWKLPIVYVCENNLYSEYTFYRETMAGDLKARASAFGLQVDEVDGQDVGAVFSAAQCLIEHARSDAGPGFLVCNTYRYYGHHVGDINRTYYRSKEEEDDWKANRDPVKILASNLISTSRIDVSILEDIEYKVQQEILDGVNFAIKAPYPQKSEVSTHVYA